MSPSQQNFSHSDYENDEHREMCKKHGRWSKNGISTQAIIAFVVVPIVIGALVFLWALGAEYESHKLALVGGYSKHPYQLSACTALFVAIIFACSSLSVLLCKRDACLVSAYNFKRWTLAYSTSLLNIAILVIEIVALAFYNYLSAAILGLVAILFVGFRIGLGYGRIQSTPAMVMFYVSVLLNVAVVGYAFYMVQQQPLINLMYQL